MQPRTDTERRRKKEKGPKVSDKETGCLTFTSAFLLRRLLAAAERQKETPSDGSVHIIHLQDRSRPPGRCSHDGACTHWPQSHLLIKAPPDLECRHARSPSKPRCPSPSSLEGRTEKETEKKSELNLALPLKKKKKPSLRPTPGREKKKISIQLAPPNPDQLAKTLDKQRASSTGRRWVGLGDKKKSPTNSPYNPNSLAHGRTHGHR